MDRLFQALVLRSWWVILFMLLCYMLYEHGLRSRDADFVKLNQQFVELHYEKKRSKTTQENLLLQINSQSDPGWVETVLMRELGLVPEGYTKVYFTPKETTK